MSKIRQAVNYERRLTKAKRKRMRMSIEYERKLTDQQMHEVEVLALEHRAFHDREHILYDDTVEKASNALQVQMITMQNDLDKISEASHGYMTVARFEREHEQLIERIDTKFGTYDEKISGEHEVTIRQDATAQLIKSTQDNRRWIIGIMISIFATFALTALHILGIIH